MRKAVAGIVVLLLLAGAATGFFFFEKHRGRDVRGSTTEFVPALVPSLRPPASSIVWPMFGYDAARLHVAPDVRLRPPFKIGWVSGGRTLLEFPPAIAEGRLYLATGYGHLLAVSVRDGSRAWDYDVKRCAAASPAVGPHAHGTVYETFLNRLPCKNRTQRTERSSRSPSDEEAALAPSHRRKRDLAAPRRPPSLRRRLAREGVRPRREQRAPVLDVYGARRDQDRHRVEWGPALLRGRMTVTSTR
jgi:FOG: WD40-like repeat